MGLLGKRGGNMKTMLIKVPDDFDPDRSHCYSRSFLTDMCFTAKRVVTLEEYQKANPKRPWLRVYALLAVMALALIWGLW